jgi:heat-inducible transcriptional repressor
MANEIRTVDIVGEALDPVGARRQRVLGIVIQEYTKTAQPVGSHTIANSYELGVSAATIRNDLAALEREGLLTHPHTSAGRIPTDAGYRFFVHRMLTDQELSADERTQIRGEFRQVRQELDQWLRMSTSVLARTSQSAALAIAPRAFQSRFKHLELVEIHDTKVLMVLVLQEGTVKQQIFDLDAAMSQDELSRLSNELNARLRGCSADEVDDKLTPLAPQESETLLMQQVALLAKDVMVRHDHQSGGQIYRDGLTQVLEAPEFVESASMRKIVRVFEQRSLLDRVIDETLVDGDVHVVIAGDGRYDDLSDLSLVIGSYGVSERAVGVVGVMGPLRMAYGRNISAVRFVAGLMSDMVQEIYGYLPNDTASKE